MPLGDSNFDRRLKLESNGDLVVKGPITWTGVQQGKRLLTVRQAARARAADGSRLPGAPLGDVAVYYVLIKGSGADMRTCSGVTTVQPGASSWSGTVSAADYEASGIGDGEIRAVAMAVSINYTKATPAFETLTWCVKSKIG
jgi:hypothetical protein